MTVAAAAALACPPRPPAAVANAAVPPASAAATTPVPAAAACTVAAVAPTPATAACRVRAAARPVPDAARLACAVKVATADDSTPTDLPPPHTHTHHTPDTEKRFTVAAFCAQRRELGKIQNLVEWAGFHLMGAETAYTWEYASGLSCRADRASFRAFRHTLLKPMGNSSGLAGTDARAAASLEDAHDAAIGGVASSAACGESTDSPPGSRHLAACEGPERSSPS